MNIYEGLIISCLLLLLLGIIADIFDAFDFDLDVGDFEIGDLEVSFLPISLRALSLGGIVYCSMCLIFGDNLKNIIINGIVAYISACAVATLTKFLKKNESTAQETSVFVNERARVEAPIENGQCGSVSCSIKGQSVVTFVAKSESGVNFKAGAEVQIKSVINGVATVVAID